MATKTHEIKIVPNTGATAELAPYIGHYITKGTKEFADFAKIVASVAHDLGLEPNAIYQIKNRMKERLQEEVSLLQKSFPDGL